MNSLYNQINQSNIQQIKQMMDMLKNSQNPQMMLQNIVNQNPNMQQVMNLVKQSGGDAKSAFYNLAKQKGIDPNQILSMLK